LPTWISLMSLAKDVAAGVHTAGTYGAVRTSMQYVRGNRDKLSPYDVMDSYGSYGYGAVWTSLLSSMADHFVAPQLHVCYFKDGRLRCITPYGPDSGPGIRHTGDGTAVFIKSNGMPAFEEFAESIVYVTPDMIEGNRDMLHDTNRALSIGMWWEGWSYRSRGYRDSQLVTHHDITPGTLMVLPRPVHSTRSGGLAHIGSSTVINGGGLYQWVAQNWFWGAANTIWSTRWRNFSVITGDQGASTSDDA